MPSSSPTRLRTIARQCQNRAMFIRRTTTGAASDGSRHPTHRLVETFRVGGKVRQRTLLNLGRHFSVPREDWPTLCRRIEELLVGQVSLAPVEPDTEASARLICRQLLARKGREAETPGPDWQTVDVNSATDFEPRSVGVEHAALAAVERFGLPTLLDRLGFNRRMKACAIASIVARMAVPGSERAALAWLRRRSGLGELLDFDMAGLGDMALHRASDLLMDHRDAIEDHLFERARSLFDFAPTVALYDLTNTYLTGRPAMPKAKRGHSKENRTDCPLLTLALVLDGSGFVRRSRVYPGNVAERDTMFEMLKSLGAEPGSLVVMDAGIADADNLAELRQAGYRYLVVSRERTRRFDADEAEAVRTASRQQVHIYKTVTDVDEDGNVVREARLHCFSEARAEKERGIMKRFMDRFENGLREIDEGLSRPRTRKRRDLVQRRIGRLQKASSRAARHYEVTIKAEGERAVAVTWELKPVDGSMLTHPGVYCLRSNELDMTAEEMWRTYVTLTDLEAVFRSLKSELGLRPIYHSKERRAEGHLFISVLAYQCVQALRMRLRGAGCHDSWETVRTVLQPLSRITTSFKRADGRTLHVRKTTVAEPDQAAMYDGMGLAPPPRNVKKTII